MIKIVDPIYMSIYHKDDEYHSICIDAGSSCGTKENTSGKLKLNYRFLTSDYLNSCFENES